MEGGSEGIEIRVDLVEALGSESFVYGTPVGMVDDEHAVPGKDRITVKMRGKAGVDVGDVMRVAPNAEEAHIFDAASGESLRRAGA